MSKDNTLTLNELHNARQTSDALCEIAEKLGYRRGYGDQLQCSNGAFVSSLLDFFEDNPGAIEAIYTWIEENYESDLEANQEEADEDDESDPEACPGCGCKPGDGITEWCDDPIGCGYAKTRKANG